MTPIVDTHHHLWDLSRFHLPWLDGLDALNRSFLMADYQQAVAGLPIEQTVYMEVDVAAEQKAAEAEYVIGLCEAADNPIAGAVISGDPADETGFREHIERFAASRWIKGVRRVLHVPQPGECLKPTFQRSVAYLGDLGLSFDLCLRPGELADARRLVDACPDTTFVLDHCGNVSVKAFAPDADPAQRAAVEQWRRDIDALAAIDRVTCKISGVIAGAGDDWDADRLAPPIRCCLDAFGPDRVLFGGDWPVCNLTADYRGWVDALLAITSDRSDADNRKLFRDNAMRVYRLD